MTKTLADDLLNASEPNAHIGALWLYMGLPDPPPDEDELCALLPYCPDDALTEAGRLASAIPSMLDMANAQRALAAPDAAPVENPQWRLATWPDAAMQAETAAALESMREHMSAEAVALVEDAARPRIAFIVPGLPVVALDAMIGFWSSMANPSPNPLAPLLQAVPAMRAARPHEIEADDRATGIAQGSLFDWGSNRAPSILTLPLHDNDLPLQPGLVEPESAQLSLTGMGQQDSPIVPSSTLILVEEAGFGALSPGNAARWDKRLFTHPLLGVPYQERRPGGRYTLRPPLHQIVDRYTDREGRERPGWLMAPPYMTRTGKGKRTNWQPGRHAQLLARSMNAVTLAGMKLQDGRTWRPVMFRAFPDFRNLQSRAVIEIALPDELPVSGPLINRDELIADGMVSDMAFDGNLTLATLWDEAKAANGGFRIYATRPKVLRDADGYLLSALRGPGGAPLLGADGEPQPTGRILGHERNPFQGRNGRLIWRQGEAPQRNWRHPDAVRIGEERHPHADRVPPLDRNDRRRLFYGHGSDKLAPSARTMAANRADARLDRLATAGRIVIEDAGNGLWHILEAARNAGGA